MDPETGASSVPSFVAKELAQVVAVPCGCEDGPVPSRPLRERQAGLDVRSPTSEQLS